MVVFNSMKRLIKGIVPFPVWEGARNLVSWTRRLFLELVYTASPNPFVWGKLFSLVRLVRPVYSMVPPLRLRLLYELSKDINKEQVLGDIVECGVFNGGSAALLMVPQLRASSARKIWLFDSFEGLPPPTENDGEYEREHYFKGWCGGTAEKVQELFNTLRIPLERTHIVKGWFEDTFPKHIPQVEEVALLHIDADWYDSVKICLDALYPKVVKGGYVVLDDFGAFSGCRKALTEYIEQHAITAELQSRDGKGVYFKKL